MEHEHTLDELRDMLRYTLEKDGFQGMSVVVMGVGEEITTDMVAQAMCNTIEHLALDMAHKVNPEATYSFMEQLTLYTLSRFLMIYEGAEETAFQHLFEAAKVLRDEYIADNTASRH